MGVLFPLIGWEKNQNSKIGLWEAGMTSFQNVKALTFDLFGTILDLAGSLTPFVAADIWKLPGGPSSTPCP
jgi:hypothetical protein